VLELEAPPLPEPPVLELEAPPLPEAPVLGMKPLPEPPALELDAPPLPEAPPELDAPPRPVPPVLGMPPLLAEPPPPPEPLALLVQAATSRARYKENRIGVRERLSRTGVRLCSIAASSGAVILEGRRISHSRQRDADPQVHLHADRPAALALWFSNRNEGGDSPLRARRRRASRWRPRPGWRYARWQFHCSWHRRGRPGRHWHRRT